MHYQWMLIQSTVFAMFSRLLKSSAKMQMTFMKRKNTWAWRISNILYFERGAHWAEYTVLLWHKAVLHVNVICVKKSLSANQIDWSELILMLSNCRLANLLQQPHLTLLNENSLYNTVFLTFCPIKSTIERHCSLDLGIFSRTHFI